MGRPKKQIRTWRRGSSGLFSVAFAESPGHWHATPYDDEEAALRWAKHNRDRILKAEGDGGPRLRDYAAGFFDRSGAWVRRQEAKGHHFGDGYLATRRGHLDNYIIPLWGDLQPSEITERRIDDDLLEIDRAGATKNKVLYSLGLILGDIASRGIIPANPLANLRPYSKAPVAPRSALPREALALMYPSGHAPLVKVWGSSMWASLMLVLQDTGLRPGEVRALRWAEWFFEDRFFPVRHGIEAGTRDTVKGLKTEEHGAKAKPAFTSHRTAQEIEVWRAESRHAEPNDFIFSEDGKKPLSNEGITKAFRRAIKALGIDADNWTPYWLRHSFGTYQLESLTDAELFALMGHSNIVTSKIYRHPDDLTLLRSATAIRDKLDAAREPGEVLEFRKGS